MRDTYHDDRKLTRDSRADDKTQAEVKGSSTFCSGVPHVSKDIRCGPS